MAPAGVLERRRTRRLPRLGGERWRRATRIARHALTVATVIAATLAAAYVALNTYTQTRNLSVGQIQLSIEPGHKGALDLYVPLVDWGVRFEDAIRLPVRLHVDLRTVDRGAVAKVANGGTLDLQDGGDRDRAGRPPAAARPDRRAAVLRVRAGHPASAAGRRGRAAVHPPARRGARRAACRPRPPGDAA